MALSFSGLSSYTKQLVKPLLTSAVFEAKTQQVIKDGGIIIPQAKSVVAIPLMDTDAFFQTDSCGWNASGTTTISQRSITVGKIKIEETICPKDFEAYFTQEALKAGSTYEDFGNSEFQAVYLEKKNKRIAAQLETLMWTGSVSGGDKFDGFSTLIDAGSPIDANVSGFTGVATMTAITQSNVIAATEGIYKAIPASVMAKGDVKIFVGYDWYRLLILAYRALNMFSYNPQDVNANSFILPATNVEIIAVNGLNGTGDAYATHVSNMAMAVDLVDEEQSYKLFYSEDFNEIRFRCAFKMGVNVAYTNQCVKFKSTI